MHRKVVTLNWSAPASGGWWDLNGTITSCIAAYQPKGAESFEASKVNLVNPATYTLTNGTYYPSWSSTGWKFTSNTSYALYLATSIVPTSSYTIIARYSSNPANEQSHLIGTRSDNDDTFSMCPRSWLGSANNYWFQGTSIAHDSRNVGLGVIALAGVYGYHDGDLAVTLTDTNSITYQYPFFIGTINNKGVMTANTGCESIVSAVAFYSTILSATQIANLTAAMNAL